jgi:hypothetical protein
MFGGAIGRTIMADRASASIVIGGTISRSTLADLIAAISEDGGRVDWDGHPLDASAVSSGKTLEACAHELSGGMFEWTEEFCEDHGLAYVRDSGSCTGAFGPERVVFTGTGAAVQFDMTESEEIVLARNRILELGSIEAIEAWFELAEFTPPPITIVEEEGAAAPVAEALDG